MRRLALATPFMGWSLPSNTKIGLIPCFVMVATLLSKAFVSAGGRYWGEQLRHFTTSSIAQKWCNQTLKSNPTLLPFNDESFIGVFFLKLGNRTGQKSSTPMVDFNFVGCYDRVCNALYCVTKNSECDGSRFRACDNISLSPFSHVGAGSAYTY
jgi:hypothetical protein